VAALTPAHGFHLDRIATVDGARELAFAPDGALFVGTRGGSVYVIPNAGSNPGTPREFISLGDGPDAGVTFGNGSLYVGTQHAIWQVPYRSGELHPGTPKKLADVRTGSPPAGSDGDVHTTTSVAVVGSKLYASVGSSCNACVETDPTRATIGIVQNGTYTPIARRIRNAIALFGDPQTNQLWASDAGQDELPTPHPYEFIDDVTAHHPPVDYGWPFCYENHKHKPGTNENCSRVALPRVLFPAYETPIGGVFYPLHPHGRYAFPAKYDGGAFVTLHGSWHGPSEGLPGYLPPRVVFVPMHGDDPARPVDWSNPTAQWTQFIGAYQQGGTIVRNGRPTGIAIGPQGDLFIADDMTGAIYRIRP
jgi:glucose/arabinose dehydrogenase